MGTDIHLFAEVKRNGAWVCAEELRGPAEHEEAAPREVPSERDIGRSYSVFAILAGVRAGTRTRSPTKPISFPKGLPADCSDSIAQWHQWWTPDAHDPSWLSLRELAEFGWDDHWVLGRGFVPANVAAAIGTELRRRPIYIDKNGAHCGPSHGSNSGVEVTWTETYREAFGEALLDQLLRSLKKLGPLDSVRIVFWFDS